MAKPFRAGFQRFVRRCVPMPYPHRGQLDSQRPARLGEPVGRGAGGLHLPTESLRRAVRRPGERRPGSAVGGGAVPDDRRHIDVPLARCGRGAAERGGDFLGGHPLCGGLPPTCSPGGFARCRRDPTTAGRRSVFSHGGRSLPWPYRNRNRRCRHPIGDQPHCAAPRRWSAHQRGDSGAEPTPLNQLAPPPHCAARCHKPTAGGSAGAGLRRHNGELADVPPGTPRRGPAWPARTPPDSPRGSRREGRGVSCPPR